MVAVEFFPKCRTDYLSMAYDFDFGLGANEQATLVVFGLNAVLSFVTVKALFKFILIVFIAIQALSCLTAKPLRYCMF